jgi:alkylation response protein AidB-like acyl-CoA dehydrogenase
MDFRDSPEEAAFRQEVCDFIRRELPPGLAQRRFGALFGGGGGINPIAPLGMLETHNIWVKKLAERGWIAPAWPKEYGGAGMSLIEQFIFNEEMARAGAPRGANIGIGVGWAGPTIILFGTDEQKKQHLPPILRGETIWCQGFSEPEAGSDLANVQTRAVRDGDDYVLNGHKIWTSGAHIAHWMILLVRTDPDAPKHKGISYFLADMKSPGMTVRPLANMAGNEEFTEVFFDNVRLPKENLLGEENRGWYIGAATLDFERSGIATGVSHALMVEELLDLAREQRGGRSALGEASTVRFELADRAVEAQVEQMLCYQVVGLQARGQAPNKESSVAKLYSSELDARIAATAMKVLGLYGQLRTGSPWAAFDGYAASTYLYATTSTIGGGSSEIQRNIIAMRGLGLPRG